MQALHATITGLVQGVGYRYFAARRADALGVHGFARNLTSGSVEVVALGERQTLEHFLAELRIGPRSALVRDVRVQWEEDVALEHPGFEIR